MAAGDFSASTSLKIQALMEQAFNDGNQAVAEFRRPVVSAQALTTNQTADIREITDRSDRCIGYEVYWQKGTTDAATYSGLISGDSLNCTISGTKLESDGKLYQIDSHVRYNVGLNTGDCDNEITANMRRMKALEKAFNNIRVGFNTVAINFLNANKQDNQFAGVADIDRGNGAWAENADGKTIELPSADTTDEKALAWIDIVCQNNDLSNYFLLHGIGNWYELFYNAQYTRLNDNERSIFATFADRNHYYDTRYLNSTLSENMVSFAVNPSSLVFLNKPGYNNMAAELISPKDGMYGWSMPDPVWQWNKGGVLTPVMYTIIMTKGCAGRDADGKPTFDENYEVSMKYDLATGPEGRNGETGIVKFMGQAGV